MMTPGRPVCHGMGYILALHAVDRARPKISILIALHAMARSYIGLRVSIYGLGTILLTIRARPTVIFLMAIPARPMVIVIQTMAVPLLAAAAVPPTGRQGGRGDIGIRVGIRVGIQDPSGTGMIPMSMSITHLAENL